MLKKVIFTVIFVSFSTIFAQNNTKEECPCCTENHAQFDFWIGDWTVYDTNGKVIGTNKISKIYDKCILREEWKSSTDHRGTSNNFYNKVDDSWNQVWVDNAGFTLELKGKLKNGSMVLKSIPIQGKHFLYYNQITWTPNKDGSVTQLWELYKEDGTLLRETFRGIYKKTKN